MKSKPGVSEFNVVIPARFASQRLPGKPLLEIGGKPMVCRVYEQATKSNASRVIVATDDERIRQVVHDNGGEVCMTSANHPSGTDRLTEVAVKMGMDDKAVIVNVQGDEPLIPPAVINQVAQNLFEYDCPMATLSESIHELADILDPNAVKVVSDETGFALYFSRAPIPWYRDGFDTQPEQLPAEFSYQRHLGIYAYRVSLLKQFVTWPVAPLEALEKLEQLRALCRGVRIHVASCCESMPPGVDTEADLTRTRDYWNKFNRK